MESKERQAVGGCAYRGWAEHVGGRRHEEGSLKKGGPASTGGT